MVKMNHCQCVPALYPGSGPRSLASVVAPPHSIACMVPLFDQWLAQDVPPRPRESRAHDAMARLHLVRSLQKDLAEDWA